jgi:hypothetical protein
MCIHELNTDLRARRQLVRTCPLRGTTELKVNLVFNFVLISVYILNVLTNEKRGGLKVVEFDRSRFKHQEHSSCTHCLVAPISISFSTVTVLRWYF